MPLSMTSVPISSGSWTLISDGASRMVCQVLSVGAVKIHVGPSAPAENAPAIVLGGGSRESAFSVDQMTTEKVYARGLYGDASLVVMKG